MQDFEQYKQNELANPGIYRAYPISWTVEKPEKVDEQTGQKSQSVAVAMLFVIHQEWDANAEAWTADWPVGWYIYGRAYIVGKAGNVNQNAVEQLQKAGLWDGDFSRFDDPTPPNTFVLLDVREETYKGSSSIRVKWINPNADVPETPSGGFRPADPGLLADLAAKFQSQTRAIAGGGTPAPATPPPAPPTPPTAGPAPTAPSPTSPPQTPQASPPSAPRAPQPPTVAAPVTVTPPAAPPTPPSIGGGSPPPASGTQQVIPPATGGPDDPIDPDGTPF